MKIPDKTPPHTRTRAIVGLTAAGLFSALWFFIIPTMSATPDSTTPTPVTDLYPQSAIAGKSLLYFLLPRKVENMPAPPKEWRLKTYEADGRPAGVLCNNDYGHNRLFSTYDSNPPPGTGNRSLLDMSDMWPAPVLSEDEEFMVIGVRNGADVFRIKRAEAIALGFRGAAA